MSSLRCRTHRCLYSGRGGEIDPSCYTLPSISFVANPMGRHMAKPVTNAALLEKKRAARTRGVKTQD
jgi:hypothetical protein